MSTNVEILKQEHHSLWPSNRSLLFTSHQIPADILITKLSCFTPCPISAVLFTAKLGNLNMKFRKTYVCRKVGQGNGRGSYGYGPAHDGGGEVGQRRTNRRRARGHVVLLWSNSCAGATSWQSVVAAVRVNIARARHRPSSLPLFVSVVNLTVFTF